MPIEKIEVNSERVYLKHGFDGWRVVHPIKNEDGSTNWFNLLTGGNYGKLLKLAVIVILLLGLCLSYARDISECKKVIERDSAIIHQQAYGISLDGISLDDLKNLTLKEVENEPQDS